MRAILQANHVNYLIKKANLFSSLFLQTDASSDHLNQQNRKSSVRSQVHKQINQQLDIKTQKSAILPKDYQIAFTELVINE